MAVIWLAENSYICVLGWITGVICNAWYGWWQNRTQTIIAKTHIYREISTTREKGRWERKRGIKQAWYHVELNWHWWWTENMGANEAKRAFSSVVCWLAPPFFYNLRCSLQEELFSFASDVSNAWYGMESKAFPHFSHLKLSWGIKLAAWLIQLCYLCSLRRRKVIGVWFCYLFPRRCSV